MTTKTATPTGINLPSFRGDARHYQLSEPLEDTEYVIVSAVDDAYIKETYIFPADADGNVIDWGEMFGSFQGEANHEKALTNAGYRVTP